MGNSVHCDRHPHFKVYYNAGLLPEHTLHLSLTVLGKAAAAQIFVKAFKSQKKTSNLMLAASTWHARYSPQGHLARPLQPSVRVWLTATGICSDSEH